jgi:Alpha/beta hydrolase of unknown function (DUF900)
MDTRLLNELSVRRGDGKAEIFLGIKARGDLSELTNKRLVILVHGFAVPATDATSTYQSFLNALIKSDDRLAQRTFCAYWGFHWPGDHGGSRLVRGTASKATFSIRIELANQAARQLAGLLSRLERDQEVYFVAHSLGCRVVMQTLFEIGIWSASRSTEWTGAKVKGAFLMAAAVPWMFCDKEPEDGNPDDVPRYFHRRAGEPLEWVFFSAKDWVLNRPFHAGEWLHGEGGGEAVGRNGFPPGRWDHPVETKLRHSGYWLEKQRVILGKMPEMLGLATLRELPARPVDGEWPERLLPVRPWRRRSLGAPLAGGWQTLIKEDGAETDTLRQLLLG